ncbi:hypothetical protein [Salinibacterium sp. M195]|uniref:hypothetical protein n=1 Tax=Salinibacterium sp. M195 TaxID=2583374 RepID=UPI001C62ED38|nr:hypothetical protein [Salinibacterium sp. M195]QYH34851.1 glycosyltransferase family 2 protein [Salinibacterium sp. M195]
MATTEGNGASRSLTIQSVVYLNEILELERAANAARVSASAAVRSGVITSWKYVVGDCSPSPLFNSDDIRRYEQLASQAGGEFVYEYFDENLGHGGGHNRLAAQGTSDLLLFLNPDGILGPHAVSVLAQCVTDDVGAADARQLPIEHPKEFDAGSGDTSWASGACLMTQTSVFSQSGGFDSETFFLYGDDVDYSWRVKLAGYRVVHCPAARLFHDKRLSVTSDVTATEVERRYSAEASLFLADKFSRPDLVASLSRSFMRQGDSHSRAAVALLESRRASNSLATPLDRQHDVGQFVNGNYALHRY